MNDKKLVQVFHYDLYGKRQEKYEFLLRKSLENIKWSELVEKVPDFFFVKKDFSHSASYGNWIGLGDLFKINITGIKTHHDNELVSFEKFLENNFHYDYRPLDTRFINYDLKKVIRHRYSVMKHMLQDNLCLIVPRQAVTENWNHVQVSKYLSDNRLHYSNKGIPIVCPLYLYMNATNHTKLNQSDERISNLSQSLVNQIAEKSDLTFTPEKEITPGTFAPIDLLDYIYGILHSPTYRAKYKEFLKIDFPRIPYPKDQETFWQFVKLGGELRQIHLLESPVVERFITSYPVSGNNEVGKVKYEGEKVWINDTQYFDHVPQIAWEFYIGGYQPAQKWLKDRKGRQLSFEDVRHYQKIIVALTETGRIMKEIDKVEFE
jgi:predicted helicase